MTGAQIERASLRIRAARVAGAPPSLTAADCEQTCPAITIDDPLAGTITLPGVLSASIVDADGGPALQATACASIFAEPLPLLFYPQPIRTMFADFGGTSYWVEDYGIGHWVGRRYTTGVGGYSCGWFVILSLYTTEYDLIGNDQHAYIRDQTVSIRINPTNYNLWSISSYAIDPVHIELTSGSPPGDAAKIIITE